MKMLSANNSAAVLHVSSDEVVPLNGLLEQDLIAFVGNLYKFGVRPQVPPGVHLSHLIFQAGKASIGSDNYPISQLAVVPNGDIVTATTTDVAEKILRHFMQSLDDGLGYRMSSAAYKITYVSNLIAEFDHPIEQPATTFSIIESIIDKAIDRQNAPFKLKRLAFGFGSVAPAQSVTLEGVDNADFIIERRANEPYEKNRYFCSAPLRTNEHLKVLELIEKAVLPRRHMI